MTNNANPVIPAKRYFTLGEMCELLQISPTQFARWQQEHGVAVGYGGERYTRLDVVKLLQLKDTFAPFVDPFNQAALDEQGEPAADAQEVKAKLQAVLDDLQQTLA
ncbi:helix-turn-helix domain-containing protein [Neisseria lisongii]|uniref:Helix-turn-helix domain-containing protein n=1 Tax=Neisseria lisongii TaxID=2912188 RepID=A0AAW5AST6_9NEIS|nr:helix-turn-helix domain-containing protein [Neisseria lisongii]MCF7530438.1 helix-turn-helix domain-containing protein [Neisseria lisongii]